MTLNSVGIRFDFYPDDAKCSEYQLVKLLEAFGYDRIVPLHGDDDEVTFCAQKFSGIGWPLHDNEHEVLAIRKIIGVDVVVTYSRIIEAETLVYNDANECFYVRKANEII